MYRRYKNIYSSIYCLFTLKQLKLVVVELGMILSTGSGFPPGNEAAVVSSGALPVLALGLTPVIL